MNTSEPAAAADGVRATTGGNVTTGGTVSAGLATSTPALVRRRPARHRLALPGLAGDRPGAPGAFHIGPDHLLPATDEAATDDVPGCPSREVLLDLMDRLGTLPVITHHHDAVAAYRQVLTAERLSVAGTVDAWSEVTRTAATLAGQVLFAELSDLLNPRVPRPRTLPEDYLSVMAGHIDQTVALLYHRSTHPEAFITGGLTSAELSDLALAGPAQAAAALALLEQAVTRTTLPLPSQPHETAMNAARAATRALRDTAARHPGPPPAALVAPADPVDPSAKVAGVAGQDATAGARGRVHADDHRSRSGS